MMGRCWDFIVPGKFTNNRNFVDTFICWPIFVVRILGQFNGSFDEFFYSEQFDIVYIALY